MANASIPYIIAEDGFYYVAYKEKAKVPEIVVSAKGVANGLSEEYNDGWDFGPDTYNPTSTSAIPYTQTSGIYEASNYAAGGFNQAGTGKVVLQPGTYNVHTLIIVWGNVTIDGQGSVINFIGDEDDAYTGYHPAKVFLLEATQQGYYTGQVKNFTINVQSTATVINQVLTGTTAQHTVIYKNMILNCNSIAPYGISSSNGSNAVYENIYITLPQTAGVLHNGASPTGNVFKNVSIDSGTQGGAVNAYNIEGAAGAIYIIGGRILGGNYGVYFDSTNAVVDGVYVVNVELDAVSSSFGFNQVTNSMRKIGFFDVISTDPSGRHFYLAAGTPTGLFRSGGIYVGAGVTDNIGFTDYITAPSLSANPPVSGTVYQNTNPYDIEIDLPAYATTSGTAGYVTLAKGPTSSVSTIGNQYVSGDTSDSSEQIIPLTVPAGWYYEFTSSGVTFGTASVFAD